jgi:hypothetical protein
MLQRLITIKNINFSWTNFPDFNKKSYHILTLLVITIISFIIKSVYDQSNRFLKIDQKLLSDQIGACVYSDQTNDELIIEINNKIPHDDPIGFWVQLCPLSTIDTNQCFRNYSVFKMFTEIYVNDTYFQINTSFISLSSLKYGIIDQRLGIGLVKSEVYNYQVSYTSQNIAYYGPPHSKCHLLLLNGGYNYKFSYIYDISIITNQLICSDYTNYQDSNILSINYVYSVKHNDFKWQTKTVCIYESNPDILITLLNNIGIVSSIFGILVGLIKLKGSVLLIPNNDNNNNDNKIQYDNFREFTDDI